MIIDSHHHLWRTDRGDYHWMRSDDAVLGRDYTADELKREIDAVGVNATILVQAAQTEAETEYLLSIAKDNEFILGVVGWLDMDSPNFSDRFDHFRSFSKFVGVRPMLQDLEDDRWILRPRVIESLKLLEREDFPFEFLTYPRHLRHVRSALEITPNLRATIDHLSKPPIASQQVTPWARDMAEVAEFSSVRCKLSGMVTEASHQDWAVSDLAPYVKIALKLFGANRLMYGSDWPVCRLAAEYDHVFSTLRELLAPLLSDAEMARVFGANAIEFYKLGALP